MTEGFGGDGLAVPDRPETPFAIFGANVERLREQRKMTQEQLGWAAGLHQTAVSRIEKGERQPRLATVFKLAEGLQVPAAKLFEGID